MFPAEIARLGVAAPGLPGDTVGFTAQSAVKVFQSMPGKLAIGTISVFDRVQWGFARSDNEWRPFRAPNESATDFAIRTRREAQQWVENFPRIEVLFVIEFDEQDEVAEGIRPR